MLHEHSTHTLEYRGRVLNENSYLSKTALRVGRGRNRCMTAERLVVGCVDCDSDQLKRCKMFFQGEKQLSSTIDHLEFALLDTTAVEQKEI